MCGLTVVGHRQHPQTAVVVEFIPAVNPVVQMTSHQPLVPGHVTNSHHDNTRDTVSKDSSVKVSIQGV